jgi:imidazolonepropionase-like amidohydrolase
MRFVSLKSRRLTALSGLFSIILLLAGCAGEPAQEPQATDMTVFEGARVIVGDGGQPIEDAVFIVQNDQFTAVGPRGQVNVPEGATRVDLTGKTVIPAIIDSHKHLAADNRDTLVDQLQHLAYWGVGVAASLGQDNTDLAFQVRDEIIPNAARLRTAGRGLTAPEPGRTEAPYWVKTEAEARTAVQELAAKRVDLVKLLVDDRNGMYEKLSPALYTAAIDEAHKNNLRVTAHIFTLEDTKGLLRAGLDAFAHMGVRDRDIDDEALALFRERPNVILVPNLPDRGVAVDLSWISETVPAAEVARLQAAATDRPPAQQAFGIQARNLAKLNAAGVKIAFGTDGGVAWQPHVEMADMVAAGMTPAQVIVAATRNSAELLQLADVGTVEANKSADFIVLDANPLDDITNTRRINKVYLRGTEVDRAAYRARLTSQASQ